MVFVFKLRSVVKTVLLNILLAAKLHATKSEMNRPKRYFVNKFEDWRGQRFVVSSTDWLPKINDRINECIKKQPPSQHDVDGGLYVGGPGIAYMLYHLTNNPFFADKKTEFCNIGIQYITVALEWADKHANVLPDKSAFLLGNAGTYAVGAALYKTAGGEENHSLAAECLKKFVSLAEDFKKEKLLKHGSDELFVGRAGYLFAAYWLKKIFGRDVVPEKDIHELCSTVVKSGYHYSERYKRKCPLMYSYYDTEYLGAGHGLSAIMQSLMLWPSFLQSSSQTETDVQATIHWLLLLQTLNGNFPCATDEIGSNSRPEEEELIHWCHGAPGVAYLLAKAYLQWKDAKYLIALEKCGELIWKKGLLRKGPGICHGIAGSAYVFLLLYRLKGKDQLWLWRAQTFARFIFSPEFLTKARTPDCPYSLFEGWAGTVCFLSDLLCPDNAQFPFFDVFG